MVSIWGTNRGCNGNKGGTHIELKGYQNIIYKEKENR